jgi:hypothetical protein
MSFDDAPIAAPEHDWLGRDKTVEVLKDVLVGADPKSSLVVGVYGGWGSGKTSVMQMLRAALPEGSLSLWFDAWKYARQELVLWRALLLAFVEQLGNEQDGLAKLLPGKDEKEALAKELDALVEDLYRSRTITETGDLKVNWGAALPFAADLALRFATMDALSLKDVVDKVKGQDVKEAMSLIEREQMTRYRAQISSLEQFQSKLQELVKKHIARPGRRLYLFVDDLDRCLPEDAVGALEAIKLFLDLPACVFVLGMDRSAVEQGIRVRYKDFSLAMVGTPQPVDARQYLDKVVQVPFRLPPLGDERMRSFVERWCQSGDLADIAPCAEFISKGVAPNPRSVKRTLNVLRLMRRLGAAGQDLRYLAKLVVMQTSYEDDYRRIVDDARELKKLEAEARRPAQGTGTGGDPARRRNAMLAMEPFFATLNDDQLAELIFLTATTA